MAHAADKTTTDSQAPIAGASKRRTLPPLVIISLGFIAIVTFIFIFAGVLAPKHYTTIDLINRLKPPSFLGGRNSTSWARTNLAVTC